MIIRIFISYIVLFFYSLTYAIKIIKWVNDDENIDLIEQDKEKETFIYFLVIILS